MNALTLPPELRRYEGKIADLDSHEMLPAQEWVKHFGPEVQPLVDYFMEMGETEAQNVNTPNIPDYPGDILPIDENIVNIKGSRAPGAVSPERRVEVMNAMGIGYQLYYPTALAIMGFALYKSADNPNFMSSITGDRRAIAKRWLQLYNEWLKDINLTSDRIRAAALLFGDTPEELIQQAEEHIKAGFKAVMYVPAAELPGGRSPAHPDLDPLWARLAEANVAFTLHIEAEGTPLKESGWRDAPAFKGFLSQGEFNTDPGFLAQLHLPYENFITIMLLGGVFERHPALRVGVIEVGAQWVGPLIRRLNMWHDIGRKFARQEDAELNPTYRLPEKPSFYFKRNVRVTPFVFEDVAHDITTYDLQKVLCFSTDYPHVEGGKNAFSIFYNKIADLGEDVVEDFFVNNGSWLFPT